MQNIDLSGALSRIYRTDVHGYVCMCNIESTSHYLMGVVVRNDVPLNKPNETDTQVGMHLSSENNSELWEI